ncbi:MAG: dGTP triphosphohydrolase, partial [Planctomycetota bacterium]
MLTREAFEQREDQILAPYAMKVRHSRGRRHPEPEHAYRTAYQRDRDRIVHSSAFRRLEYKTQVFVNTAGDYYRTRLTHTMEVAQIARTIARTLGLNEDLTEAIALGHDLGHGPFGHSGEDELNDLMKEHGGFEHNRHALRIVDLLERKYPEFCGLNLTEELRLALPKHESHDGGHALLEAQVVDAADQIAYNTHDVDDGLTSGLLVESKLDEVEIWQRALVHVRERYPDLPRSTRRYHTVRALIDSAVTDLLAASGERLADAA